MVQGAGGSLKLTTRPFGTKGRLLSLDAMRGLSSRAIRIVDGGEQPFAAIVTCTRYRAIVRVIIERTCERAVKPGINFHSF